MPEDHPWTAVDIRGWRSTVEKQREREALLDSYSQPPEECELYGETFVIDGERVGERFEPDRFNGDVEAVPGHTAFGYDLAGDKTAVNAWHARSKQERAEALEALTERQQRELREIERSEWAEVRAALRQMDERDKVELNERRKWRRVALGTHDLRGRKLRWPFGPPMHPYGGQEKYQLMLRPKPENFIEPPYEPTWQEKLAARYAEDERRERERARARYEWEQRNPPRHRPPEPPPEPPVELTDIHGIVHLVPAATYRRIAASTPYRQGLGELVWVYYRLGIEMP